MPESTASKNLGSLPSGLPSGQPRTTASDAQALRELVVGYAKQETVGALGGAARYLKFGLPGGILIGIGSILLMLGTIRGVQRIDPIDDASVLSFWSLVPYAAGLLVAFVIIGVCAMAIKKAQGSKEPLG